MNLLFGKETSCKCYHRFVVPVIGTIVAALVMSSSVSAGTLLQLDILGGTYDTANEDVYLDSGTANPFTLRAYYTIGKNGAPPLTSTYTLSVALTPIVSQPGFSLGTFTINNHTVDVTGDMTWGTPPAETWTGHGQDGDLAKHGIYDTYFYEHDFVFNPNVVRNTVNVQDDPGTVGHDPLLGDSGLAYVDFVIAVDFQVGFQDNYGLHFDLYHVEDPSAENKMIDAFAPFSHDAQYGVLPPVVPPPPGAAPEPSSLAVWGLLGGILCLRSTRRRRGDQTVA